MKLLIILALAAVALARPEEGHYDSKFDNFNVDEVISNPRLLKAYLHCFIGDGKCTAEGKEIKSWIPEASKSGCSKCTEKQKVLAAKSIKAIKEQLPEEFEILSKKIHPGGKDNETLKKFLEKYAP